MKEYLLDTNIPSELTYPRPEPLVVEFLRTAGKQSVHVSALTFGEICKGIGLLPVSEKRTNLTFRSGLIRSCGSGLPGACCRSPFR